MTKTAILSLTNLHKQKKKLLLSDDIKASPRPIEGSTNVVYEKRRKSGDLLKEFFQKNIDEQKKGE